NHLAAGLPEPPNVCLQVKIVPDPSKYGWSVSELTANLPQLAQCGQLKIQGLMTIAPWGLNATEVFNIFRQTGELAQRIRQERWPNMPMQELSMGMSEDYQLAIQAGATLVRLGRILFGNRSTAPFNSEAAK
ncbi:MAG TPA: YggS family pyridoxal phosphate-dependent enzyme, partial [Candidatus Caenarcaniphilales bacterium]